MLQQIKQINNKNKHGLGLPFPYNYLIVKNDLMLHHCLVWLSNSVFIDLLISIQLQLWLEIKQIL